MTIVCRQYAYYAGVFEGECSKSISRCQCNVFSCHRTCYCLCAQQWMRHTLCEINPPRLEGLFLAEKIRKINPKVNNIFVTVCSEGEYAKEIMRLKPSGYLTKEAISAQILEELQNLRYPTSRVIHSI